MEFKHDTEELQNPMSKGDDPLELIIKQIKDMEKLHISEDKFDKFLEQMTRMEDMLNMRQEQNNLIVKFGNFKSFSILQINLEKLDRLKDELILGIKTDDRMTEDQCGELTDNYQNFTSNMMDYWQEIQNQLKKTNNSMKLTDFKMLKMVLIERMLPEYAAVQLDNVIDKITDSIYIQKLKKNATKNFKGWVEKQLYGKRLNETVKHRRNVKLDGEFIYQLKERARMLEVLDKSQRDKALMLGMSMVEDPYGKTAYSKRDRMRFNLKIQQAEIESMLKNVEDQGTVPI